MDRSKIIKLFIRVNHSGEYGAVQIYKGQLGVFENDATIAHMLEQEKVHLKFFDQQIHARKCRPSILLPAWRLIGFSVGFIGAVIGRKTAMACTIAVEEVIDKHYSEQLVLLKKLSCEKSLQNKINQFRQEELDHRDIGMENQGEDAFCYKALSEIIKFGCKTAIFLSKHL